MNSQGAGINNKRPAQLLTALYITWLYGSFPSCFLTSIACPALTYLPVHLYRWGGGGAPSSFPPLSAGLLAQAVNLSAGGMVAEEEGESNGGVPVRLAR